MTLPLALLILIPGLTGALCLLGWGHRYVQRTIAVSGEIVELAIAILLLSSVWHGEIRVEQIGAWPAPYGITLVADLFSAIMVVLGAVIGLSVIVYSLGSMDSRREAYGYYPLYQMLFMGVNGSFLTGDLFNLYVWFEVMLMASFVLIALGSERLQLEGAIKYVTINLVSSIFFLSGLGILYGIAGTLNMADLAVKLKEVEMPLLVTAASMLFLISFGIKAAVFPLFFWLPACYHTPPVAISAVFAGLLTKVGIYALMRVFTLIFVQNVDFTHSLILAMAVFTMIAGVLGAVAHNEMRRILSFHVISQVGYMVMGLGLFTHAAIAGTILFIVHHVIVKTNLFLISGIVCRLKGSYVLDRLGGLYRSAPILSLAFLVSAFSLAGMPPLSGFFAKLSLVKAAFDTQAYYVVAVALIVGLLTLYSMTKIWNQVFWSPFPGPADDSTEFENDTGSIAYMMAPIVGLVFVTLSIGFGAELYVSMAIKASEQLLDPEQYIRAVLTATR